jgi:hypothetical protein
MKSKSLHALLFLALSILAACSKTNLNRGSADQLQPSNSIIGGMPNSDLMVEHLVTLIDMTDGSCSGAYIGDNRILTAAHCFNSGEVKKIYFNFKPDSILCQPVAIKIHPLYRKSRPRGGHDIAVLKFDCTEADMKIIKEIQPFEIAEKYQEAKEASIYGYGLQSIYGKSKSYPELYYLSYPKLENINNDENSDFCFRAEPERTPYLGDSGGPVLQLNENGKPVIIGVTVRLATYDVLNNGSGDPRTIYETCNAKAFANKDWILKAL